MKLRLAVIFGTAFLLASCQFTSSQEGYVDRAIALQDTALGDARFSEIFRQLEAEGAIWWQGRLDTSDEGLPGRVAQYPNATEWLLASYREGGGLPRASLSAYRKVNPFSPTTAVTNMGSRTVKLNLWNFNSNEAALANTFVHEQNHMFGLVHPEGQTRQANMCDPGYIAGDLAEALLRSRGDSDYASPHGPVCPALCSALRERGLWTHSSCPG